MKKVMLLGDSIRMGYQDEAINKLGDGYTVWKPEDNCRFAKYTLNNLRHWLPECPNPDIIHWNNGLWDIKIIHPEDGCFTGIEEYIRDMRRILRELRKTGARIIFATTTPVKLPLQGFNNDTIVEYNRRICQVMIDEEILINDLFTVVYPYISIYICEDNIHLSQAGKEACGEAVAQTIKKMEE